MRKPEIVAAVQETAQIPTREEAEAAVRATLHVLGERLDGGDTRDLAAHVPPDLARELPADGSGDPFDVNEFYMRVARHKGGPADERLARRHARAVAVALRTSLSDREFEDVATRLPFEYDDLLQTEPDEQLELA
jgi:uncharacterized protein (DUF2267 family)